MSKIVPILSGMSLLEFTERGIYCQRAGVFIDPVRGVPRALITHAHSDHARPGSGKYLCTPITEALIRHRLGASIQTTSVPYGHQVSIHGVRFSFHPAGHVAGSAQIRVEYAGEVWVVSGDYKRDPDGVSDTFEPVRCHTFITESTFGLPIYQWPEPRDVFEEINHWWRSNASQGIVSVLSAYSLGKAQRVLQQIDVSIGPVFCDPAVHAINGVLHQAGVEIRETEILRKDMQPATLKGALVIAPSAGNAVKTLAESLPASTGSVSGWMALRGRRRWQHTAHGFILSDHADWKGLNNTIKETECTRVIVTHGYTDVYARWLQSQGYDASPDHLLIG